MIAKLKGIIDEVKPAGIILDVNGVGYELQIPFVTFEKIRSLKEVVLYVHTHHREDQFRLFGFHTEQLKNIFSTLISISGIGPSMALSILSAISVERLLEAVRSDNAPYLTKIPGIGKAKADKLVFELKRKMRKLEDIAGEADETPSLKRDAVDALVALGFDETGSSNIVGKILQDNPNSTVESLIKGSLKELSR